MGIDQNNAARVATGAMICMSLIGCDRGASAPAAAAVEPAFSLGAEHTQPELSGSAAPALEVPDGAVVELFTQDASGGRIGAGVTADTLWSFDPRATHPVTGPIYVQGTRPGDVLAVTFREIEPQGLGWAGLIPGVGQLGEEFMDPYLETIEVPKDSTEVEIGGGLRIPLRPFPAVVGVAPSQDSAGGIGPGANGGRMGLKDLVEGVTLYLPVFVDGALLYVGDVRAAQGDGAVAGGGLQVPARIVLEVKALRGEWSISEPQYESADAYAVTASSLTLDDATRRATRYMVDFLTGEIGLTAARAYLLTSLAGDLTISQASGLGRVLVSLRIPKSVFPAPKTP
jgi:acetamidase/formamidase